MLLEKVMKKDKSVQRTAESAKAYKQERKAKAHASETLRRSEFIEAMRLLRDTSSHKV